MSLIRWSPFIESFDELENSFQRGLVPAVDVYDTKDAVVIEAPLPGVDPKNVELTVENGQLTINGSFVRKTEVDEKEYYRKEIRSGSFLRHVALPVDVKADEASASFENGMLTVRLPKLHSPEAKKISIQIEK